MTQPRTFVCIIAISVCTIGFAQGPEAKMRSRSVMVGRVSPPGGRGPARAGRWRAWRRAT